LKRSSKIKSCGEVIGSITRVKVMKDNVGPPFREAEGDIMYGKGISRSGGILDWGVEYGFVKKSGSWFSYGDTKLGQGRDAVKQLIEDNPELEEQLNDELKAAIAESKAEK